MIFDALVDSIKHDIKRAFYLYTPMVVTICLFFAQTTLPTYSEQRGMVILMVNYVIAVQTFNLMLHNMTGKSFSIAQPALLLLIVPLVAHYILEISAETQRMLPITITAIALFTFMYRFTVVAK